MKATAIISVYNEEKTIKNVVRSVSESSIVSEIIVVNDSSTDNTKKIIEKLKESRFGVETLLYFYFVSIGKTIKFIRLIGIKHKNKYKKESFTKATTSYINVGWEIAYTAMKNYDLMLKTVEKLIRKKIKT